MYVCVCMYVCMYVSYTYHNNLSYRIRIITYYIILIPVRLFFYVLITLCILSAYEQLTGMGTIQM